MHVRKIWKKKYSSIVLNFVLSMFKASRKDTWPTLTNVFLANVNYRQL